MRVLVTTLLMGFAFVEELGQPGGELVFTPRALTLFVLIGASYAVAIAVAAVLRARRPVQRLATAQIAVDLVVVTVLVHATGGAESGFAFLYLLLVVGGATVLSARGTAVVTALAVLAFVSLVVGERLGLVPALRGDPSLVGPLRPVLRTLATMIVAIVATAALARRLAVELERAGQRLADEGSRFLDLATLYGDVVRSLTSGLVTVDSDGRVSTCNAAAEEILGVAPAAALGEPLATLLPGLPSVARGQRLARGELTVKRRGDGAERLVGASISPLYAGDGRAVGQIVNFQDLTELGRMRAQVEQAERLAAIGRLAAGVAHEIRNPLAAISGCVEMLRSGPLVDGDSREMMDIVVREIDRLNHLVTELLEWARPRAPELVPVELAASLREFARVASNDPLVARHAVELHAERPAWVDADMGQLRQVLWNLVRNAAEASPDGAPITIGLDVSDKIARVAVRDRGPGFGEEHRARLFEPFFSTKKGGTGLGLALVHRFVEAHAGRVEVANADGGGAEVAFVLPVSKEGGPS